MVFVAKTLEKERAEKGFKRFGQTTSLGQIPITFLLILELHQQPAPTNSSQMINFPPEISPKDFLPLWRAMATDIRSKAYSPSSMVKGDIGPLIQSYILNSKTAYQRCPHVMTQRYGTGDAHTIDIAVPETIGTKTALPLHVFIHGGYWCELSKLDSFFLAPDTLAHGLAFAAVDYTLAPHATLDEIVDECCRAVELVHDRARELGIDPTRIIVSGSSAGAHLAAMTCLKLQEPYRPCAAALVSGIFDLKPLIGTYINDPIKLDEVAANRNSPAELNLSGFPPTLIAWGAQETDEFKRQSLTFAHLLTAVDVAVDALEVSGFNHFDIVEHLANDSLLGSRFYALVDRIGEH